MGLVLFGLLSGLLTFIIPIALIVWIVRLFVRHDKSTKKHNLTFRELILAFLITGAAFCGLMAINFVPIALFSKNADNAVFAGRLVISVGLLIAGLILREIVGIFLMVMGILGLIMASPFIFENLGSAGALIVVVLAFIGLLVAAIKIQNKGTLHG